METARSETTLTDLSGCDDLTFDATNCTQIDRDIRCAMPISNFTKFPIPYSSVKFVMLPLPPFDSSLTLPSLHLIHSRRIAENVDGTAARITEIARTIPMSSSSERWASCAASSSSCAIPRETENARSDPSEPSAPVVAIREIGERSPETSLKAENLNYTITSSEVRAVSHELCQLDPLLAYQEGLTLPIRRLLISPITTTNCQGRGGKALRERVGSTHRHWYSGSIFGCLLGPAMNFVRRYDDRTCDMLRTLHKCLMPAGKDVMTCTGTDAAHIQRGFASHHAIRGQLSYLDECKSTQRIDSKYGKKTVVLGISACIYFVMKCLASKVDNSVAMSNLTARWLTMCNSNLVHWRSQAQVLGGFQYQALEAERRTIQRGALGMRRGRKESHRLGLAADKAICLELEYTRKAMWPVGRKLQADTQSELIAWIHSDDFLKDVEVPHRSRSELNITVNIPLSAIPMLSGSMRDGDAGSSYGSESSISSLSSVSSTVGDGETPEMSALTSMLASVK